MSTLLSGGSVAALPPSHSIPPLLPPSLTLGPTGRNSRWGYLSFFPSFSPAHFLTKPEQKAPLSENGSRSRQTFLFRLKEVNKVYYGYVTREGESVGGEREGKEK